MRSIWKGSISFGLVSIPIKVLSATENHSVSFRQVHTTDGGRIRYRKVCELDDEEVPAEEIGKAYETSDGTKVQLTDADLASLPLPTAKTVEILAFVPAEEIDPIQLDRSYYLSGDGQSASKPYVLLKEALTRSGKVAITKLAMRGRETLGMLRVYEDTLTLHTMLWPDEIRPVQGVAPGEDVSVRDAELDLADTLMETLGEIDMSELHDDYREAVEALVAAKEEGAEVPTGAEAPAASSGKVVDLMAVLENSVQAAKGSRGEEGADADVHQIRGKKDSAAKSEGKSGAAKKSVAGKTGTTEKKTTAKKSTAQKSTAQKSTAKKSAAKSASGGKQAAGKQSTGGKQSGTAKKASAPKKTAAKRTPRKSA